MVPSDVVNDATAAEVDLAYEDGVYTRLAIDAGETGAPRRRGYWMWTPEIARAMTSRWISEVPSKIV